MKPVEIEFLMRGNLKKGMQDAQHTAMGLDSTLKGVRNTVVGLFAADKIADFGRQVVNVRKEMQSLQTSFRVLLQDQDKADKMFGQLKSLAATTPLMLKDLASGAQTMLGFGIASEKVVPTLEAIGNIAMGDGEKLKSLTLAFSQMSATGKLMGQDLLQMINAGFNPLMVISQKTGKSIAVLKDEMSKGAISAEMVADAFMAATAEGGKFHGMLEQQGKTLAGQMNQLQGAIDDMFNSIGEQTEGVIAGAISATQKLVENYEKVGKVIVTLIATYGTYKAAQLTVMAIEKAHSIYLMAERVGWQMVSKSIWEAVKATKAYTIAAKAAPYALVAVLVTGVATAMWNLAQGTDAATAAQNKLSNARQKFKASIESDEKEAERLIRLIQDQEAGADEKSEAYEQLTQISNTFCKQYDQEAIAAMNLSEALEKVNAANKGRLGAMSSIQLGKLKETEKYLVSLKTYYDAKEGKGEVVRLKNVHDSEIAEIEREKKEKIEQAKNVADAVARAEMEAQAEADAKKKAKKADEKYQKGVQAALTAPGTRSKNVSEILENATIGKNDIEQWLRKIRDEKAKIESEIAEDNAAPSTTQAEKIYSEEAKRLMKDWKTAKKTYKALLKDKTATEKQVKSARSAVDAADTAYETLTGTKASAIEKKAKEQAKQLAKAQQDANFEARQSRINEVEEGSDKAIQQLQLDFDKKKAEIEREYKEQIALAEEFTDDKAKAEMKANAEALKEVRLTLAEQERDKGKTDVKEAEAKSMRDYLTEWGTMQEKRAAITEEYNERIRKATTEGEKKALQEEMKAALSTLDMSEFKDKVNWEVIFGDLNSYTKKQLKTLKKQLQDFKKDDKYIKASIEDKKVVDDALNALSDEIINKGGIFGGLAQAFEDLSKAENELADATTAVNNAKTGTKEREEAEKRKNRAEGQVTQSQGRVRSQAEKARDSIAGLASQITALGTASEMTLSDLGSLAGNIVSQFSEKAGGWVEAIFVVMDMVARNGIEGLVQNVGKLVGQGLGGLFGIDIDENTHYYEEQKKLNDNYLKLIEETISKQEELLKKQSGMAAVETYEEAKKELERKQEINAKNVKNYLNAGASKGFWGIGSSASNGVKLSDKFSYSFVDNLVGYAVSESGKRLDALKEIMGVDSFSKRMEELATATVEQIQLMKENRDIWANLPDDIQNYYQEILDANEAAEKLAETWRESETAISFDNLRSSFLNLVKDVKNGTKEMLANIDDMMSDAILNFLTSEDSQFYTDIQKWYKMFADAMTDGLDKTEAGNLREEYERIYKEVQAKRDEAYKKAGIDQTESTTQSGKAGAFETMTQDQGTKLEGLFTSGQIHWASMDDLLGKIADRWGGLLDRLGELVENTSYCRHLADMADDIKAMRRDGLKMR